MLQSASGRLVEAVVLLGCARPEVGEVGFIPDLPVADVGMESVVPSLVVVADDVFDDSDPFLVTGRWSIVTCGAFAGAGAEAKDDVDAEISDGFDVGVG